ncbi:hypothetical protein Scep_009473 [Stephania cephalantha]|uniref:Uncharacterized protein n=1 Tax=Stephania cephalantha TaxID=152367 RepID=A0AAP0PD74_9MAGN
MASHESVERSVFRMIGAWFGGLLEVKSSTIANLSPDGALLKPRFIVADERRGTSEAADARQQRWRRLSSGGRRDQQQCGAARRGDSGGGRLWKSSSGAAVEMAGRGRGAAAELAGSGGDRQDSGHQSIVRKFDVSK